MFRQVYTKGPVDIFMLAWVIDHLVPVVFRLLAWQVLHNACNMGMRALPEMYACVTAITCTMADLPLQSVTCNTYTTDTSALPQVRGRVHILRQSTSACGISNMYHYAFTGWQPTSNIVKYFQTKWCCWLINAAISQSFMLTNFLQLYWHVLLLGEKKIKILK